MAETINFNVRMKDLSKNPEFIKGDWAKSVVTWTEGDTAFLSVVFTWQLPEAYELAVFYKTQGFKVRAGGPGVFRQKGYLDDVAEVGGSIPDTVRRHNPSATFASRGCDADCWFCIVPKMEGKTFTFIPDFHVRPILCDNNLSALPTDYQQHIVDRYIQAEVPLLDANSGFEPSDFDEGTFHRWNKINKGPWRQAFDEIGEAEDVKRMLKILAQNNVPKNKRFVYTIIGNEPFATCMERIYKVIEWGGEPYVQPLMKLHAIHRKPWVRFDWTRKKLEDVARWCNGRVWRRTKFEITIRRNGPYT